MEFQANIADVITILEKNLEDHKKELAEAREVWTEKVKIALDNLKDSVDRKSLDASHDELFHLFNRKPVDNRKEYSRFIGALSVSLKSGQSIIKMDEYDYDRMFNDNWEWRSASKLSNSFYKR